MVSILALCIASGPARVSADGPETAENYSNARIPRSPSRRAPMGARAVPLGLAGVGLAGAACLAAASWATVIALRVPGSAPGASAAGAQASGLDRHGPALLVVAAFAALLLVPALRGARAAMAALAVAGLLALGIAVAEDVPALDDAGPVTVLGEEAVAEAGPGFFLETLGGTLLLLAGGGLLLLPGGLRRARPGPDARTPPEGAASGPARDVRHRYQR